MMVWFVFALHVLITSVWCQNDHINLASFLPHHFNHESFHFNWKFCEINSGLHNSITFILRSYVNFNNLIPNLMLYATYYIYPFHLQHLRSIAP